MTAALYRDFHTTEELDAEYDIEATVPDFTAYVDSYVTRSEAVRESYRCDLDVRYGAQPGETYDVFYPASSWTGPRPCLYFIHGGYWKATTSKDWSFVARGLCDLGFVVVIADYTLRPAVTVPEILQQHRAGFCHFRDHIDRYGADPERIVIAGHSVGGHAVATFLQTDWSGTCGLPEIPYRGALAISGLYDLRPLPHVSFSDELGLDAALASQLSPELHPPERAPRLVLAYGSHEPAEFARQTTTFSQTLRGGGVSNDVIALAANHFDICDSLADASGELARAAVSILEL